jgi:hypothetical protein
LFRSRHRAHSPSELFFFFLSFALRPLAFPHGAASALTIVDPYAWERSSVNQLALGDLVSAGQLAANEEGRPAE